MNFSEFGSKLLLLAVLALAGNACNNRPSTPPTAAQADDANVEKAVSEALRKPVEKEMTIPVALKFDYFKTADNYAFALATMQQPDGQQMNFAQTPFKTAAEAGGYSDNVCGLLQKENGAWNVLAITVGSTDVPSVCWWKEYRVPKALFPPDMAADDCSVNPPFVYVDNSGRIYVNGGIGLNFEEMKVELVKALGRMDAVPDKIDLSFGDEILMGTRQEVETLAAEAIAEAKAAKQKK